MNIQESVQNIVDFVTKGEDQMAPATAEKLVAVTKMIELGLTEKGRGKRQFDESKHKRDGGKFSSKEGSGSGGSKDPGKEGAKGKGGEDRPEVPPKKGGFESYEERVDRAKKGPNKKYGFSQGETVEYQSWANRNTKTKPKKAKVVGFIDGMVLISGARGKRIGSVSHEMLSKS